MKKIVTILLTVHCSLLTTYFTGAQQRSILEGIPDDIKGRKVFQRHEWFYQQRAYPYDTIPANLYTRVMSSEISRIKSNRSQATAELQWQCIGPSGVEPLAIFEHWGITSGRVRAVAIHPTDPQTVYIGAASGGIWKSTDGGQNWLDIGGGLESLSFGAIAIDPDNPEVIYAGSGEAVFYYMGTLDFGGKGLYKSTDGGQSFMQITNGFGPLTHFSDITVSPYNSDIILAAIARGNCYEGDSLGNEGIWKSMDAGLTWYRTLDLPEACDVAFHHDNPNLAYAAVGGMTVNSGFYISTDQGETWTQSNSGLQTSSTITRMLFDISLSEPEIIYSVIYQVGSGAFFSGTSRAYKSVDGGNTWTQISQGINLGGKYGGWLDQGFYDLCIAVDPVDPNHVFIGNIELHETSDGSVFAPVRPYGNNANGSFVHADYHKFAYAPSNPDYFYIGCDGGIYQSTDAAQTAVSRNQGLNTLQFYRIASHPTNPDIMMGGMQDNGSAITFDAGANWHNNISGDGMECFFDPVDPNIVYASIQNGRIAKSTDGGVTFPGFIYNATGTWITPFFLHPEDHNIIYTANIHIVKSTDAGASWNYIAQNVAPVKISAIAQSKVSPGNMIFATGGGTSPTPDTIFLVKISTDEGYTWTDVTYNIPGETRWISRVVTDPQEANTMYVLRTGFSAGNKVWKTTDLGQTWINISGDLPDLPCNDLFIDPENNEHLYVANDIGVYLSTDGGAAWTYASDGMPFVPVFDFDYVKIGDVKYLRAGTHGRSVYETNIVGVGVKEPGALVKSVELRVKSYPNPFREKSTIELYLPEDQQVSLKLFDLAGREVRTLAFGRLRQGEHRYELSAGDLDNGIYLMTISTPQSTVTKKLVIHKF